VSSSAPAAKAWEVFVVNKPAIQSGDVVSIYSHMEYPLTAESGGGSIVVANRRDVGAWEKWTLQKINAAGAAVNGAIGAGDRVALRASNNQWMVAEHGGCSVLRADRAQVGPWEIFTVGMP
jgi:hypothetical protein